MLDCLFVGLGGFAGTVCRYLAGRIPVETGGAFPIQTLLINILGAFVLGAISALAAKNPDLPPRLVLMLRVGVCGGFTTFSTFAFESSALLAGGRATAAALYMAASLILGIGAVFAAQLLIR